LKLKKTDSLKNKVQGSGYDGTTSRQSKFRESQQNENVICKVDNTESKQRSKVAKEVGEVTSKYVRNTKRTNAK